MSRLNVLIETIINEKNELTYSRKYRKLVTKNSSKPATIKALKSIIKQLEDDGKVEGHGTHRIRMPLRSEHTGKDETGWTVSYVSKADELRVGFLKHKDGTIEVKFGRPSDIGYKH